MILLINCALWLKLLTSLRKENENEKLGILDVRVRMHDNTQSWGMGKKRKMIYCNGRNF